jgi:hypothetical protein
MNLNITPTYIKNPDLDSDETKDVIIRMVNKAVRSDKTIVNDLRDMQSIEHIKNNDYIACPRYNGSRVYVVFFNYQNKYYAVNFPKRNMDNKRSLVLYPIDVTARLNVYNCSIMEGTYMKMGDINYLVIDEVYYLGGYDHTLKKRSSRISLVTGFLSANIVQNDNYQIYANTYYNLNSNDLSNLYQKIRINNSISDIMFYPEMFGKQIYQYTIRANDTIENIIRVSTFQMKKTRHPDVYDLFTDGEKIGIAHIPSIESSKRCKKWYKSKRVGHTITVKCHAQVDDNEGKLLWEPIDIIE